MLVRRQPAHEFGLGEMTRGGLVFDQRTFEHVLA
jgi:hypothetical protein